MKFLLLPICLLFSFAAHAEIYKWTDKNGQVHYGEKKIDNSAKRVFISKHEETPAKEKLSEQQRLDKVKKWVDVRKQERHLEKQRKVKKKKITAQNKKKCNSLKNNLNNRERGGVTWYSIDKNGERKYHSDQDIEKNTNMLRDQFKKNCS